jgi:hypothetical protein
MADSGRGSASTREARGEEDATRETRTRTASAGPPASGPQRCILFSLRPRRVATRGPRGVQREALESPKPVPCRFLNQTLLPALKYVVLCNRAIVVWPLDAWGIAPDRECND